MKKRIKTAESLARKIARMGRIELAKSALIATYRRILRKDL